MAKVRSFSLCLPPCFIPLSTTHRLPEIFILYDAALIPEQKLALTYPCVPWKSATRRPPLSVLLRGPAPGRRRRPSQAIAISHHIIPTILQFRVRSLYFAFSGNISFVQLKNISRDAPSFFESSELPSCEKFRNSAICSL